DVSSSPELEWRETVRGVKPGNRYVRITHTSFARTGRGRIVSKPGYDQPSAGPGLLFNRLKRVLVGQPIPTAREAHERLTKVKALAVFSSDVLSSVAYATEEIMKVLVLAGVGMLSLTWPISIIIVVLLGIVVVSYRQTVQAYPSGGGSYIVASDNLGMLSGLTAASSLLIDYVLTVAVSVAAGIAAITSLMPDLLPWTVPMGVGAVLLIMLGNLRGIRESGTIFAAPTYAFVLAMYVMIAFGLFRLWRGDWTYVPAASVLTPGNQSLGLFLLMAAFAQGCSAMTGTEAVSNGVPAFKPPEWKNARATLVAMGALLGSMFLGTSFLAVHMGILPATDETVVSQLGRTVFGTGPMWGFLQVTTMLILVLAANTAFADFPRLSSILARDRFLPRVFQFRGDRLAFSTGIFALSGLSILLLIVFRGSVDALIPLYAVGVFLSFTLSQAGMVRHWRRERGRNWRRSALINGTGAVATGIVALVIATTKFVHGAWLVVLLIPLMIAALSAIHSHYVRLERARRAETPTPSQRITVRAVVPVADLGAEDHAALAYARAIAADEQHVIAVHVADDPQAADGLRAEWEESGPGAELVIIESPYRSLLGPLLAYIDALQATHPDETITVIVPEFVPSRWWEHLLHNQTALRLKAALLFHPGIVVANVPYHMSEKR
ncbi:MAG: hypothetical protein QOF51_1048, partial [Chloroflexota bacterium]|nr:hypothetical protein [Chloroflexota bacterium]